MNKRTSALFRPDRAASGRTSFDHSHAKRQEPGLDTDRFRLLALSPLERADLPLARALRRKGVAAAVDLGRDPVQWPGLLAALSAQAFDGIGLRIPEAVPLADLPLPATVGFLILAGDCGAIPESWRRLPILAQVCSFEEARDALSLGVAGLIAKGQESGGRVGDESSFVLLQRVVELAQSSATPVWCQGGIGLHTAAAAFAAGAAGVVLDAVLATLPESSLPDEIKKQILAMDGSEVRAVAGYQVHGRNLRDEVLNGMEAADVRACLAGKGERNLLAIGQDAALAKGVMAECPTLETLVNTLRMRVAAQLHQAQSLRVLDEDNAWARSHATRYPVAQGPMTRVSDNAEFCGAVADAGGLPFLALSLMKEGPSRALLAAARERVGAQSWGVGVLGFAPPEILNPQLELIKEFKPSVVLMAGGRPSQARPLVALGIPTYLHVPSPGLLELFLNDGATHFVFEGRECGGHVGPRYSFVLWEQALAILLKAERPDRLHILFAGGIHDARSSAMVAAMAAPLAALGAKIGVLMGTAYIATEEAVSCGAVLADFQRKALSGERTVLVETAPGHAIRCLPTGFVDMFNREKQRLQAESVEQTEAWKTLEALTIGRLRLVTKGVDYRNGVLAPIDAETQQAEGIYMLGQVTALKSAPTTIADLHASVTRGATRYLEAINPPYWHRNGVAEPIAIIGMACIYPGSPDLESYWANIVQGRDLVSEVPADRWRAEQYYEKDAKSPGKSPSKWGGFIDDIPFDPIKYGIPPQSLAAIEPVQLLSLAVAREALADAGYLERYFDREKTAVIFGAEAGMDLSNQYAFRNLYPQYCGDLPEALDKVLPRLTEDSFPGVLANVISGRIANRLGLHGVNYSVDSACASSLNAIELAVKELRSGNSDMALAGGADCHNSINDFLMFASVGALSPTGRCRSFDDSADGISLGEGVGVVVLKRLSDAENDGDRIYAVIDGVAGSSDGKGLGLTAPRKEGQKRALERAYWQAGVLPAEVGLMEAHGTGTVVGDRTELQTLTEVFNAGGARPGQTGLGSVKSQIGHTKCAAGIAGLIKVAKALHHRVLPPTQQVTTPNGWYRQDSSPFRLNKSAQPWVSEQARAAVSAFGFGGSNFHAVVSAYPAHRSTVGANGFPCELFAVRGADFAQAAQHMRLLADYVARSTAPLALRDLAHAAWSQGQGPVQCAFVAHDLENLKQRLAAACAHESMPGITYRGAAPTGKVAYLFPGQGSQYPGMMNELFVYFPQLQSILASEPRYASLIYPGTAYDEATRTAQQRTLTDTRHAQPALAMVERAAFGWLASCGLVPDMAGGHSFGELSALATAGAISPESLVRLARERADAILASVPADPGCMAAVNLAADALQPLLESHPQVVMANQNSPVQTVISGPTGAVEAACADLKQRNIACKRIDTACAFHSPVVAGAVERFAASLARLPTAAPRWPVYSNTTAAPHREKELRDTLAHHVASPVRFVEQIRAMYADGARVFVEVGPRRVLCGLVAATLGDLPHQCIALDHSGQGLPDLLHGLAQLAVATEGFNAEALFQGRTQPLDLNAPKQLAATTWMVNGGRAWPRTGPAPAHGAGVVKEPVAVYRVSPVLQAAAVPAVPVAQQTMLDYLANMRAMVNAQRDVLVAYLGAPVAERRDAGTTAEPPHRPAATPAAVREVVTTPPPAPVPAAHDGGRDLRAILLEVVSERTGYPAAMLDLELDLEADLSIDSIKRVEIVGELARRLNLGETHGPSADALIESLSTRKNLARMLEGLAALQGAATPAARQAEAAPAPTAPAADRLLLRIVSQCTGYPEEALDLDLDLEADLSIDSIKRLEIVGQWVDQSGSASGEVGKDTLVERLSAQKTLRAMITRLEELAGKPAATPAPAAVVAAPAPAVDRLLLDIVSQCTGYPKEALDLDLDLEADLSIDSIKRLEVVSQLIARLGSHVADNTRDAVSERLSAMKTLRAMIAWLEREQVVGAAASPAAPADARTALALTRHGMTSVAAPLPDSTVDVSGKRFVITDDGQGIAARVGEALRRRGAVVQVADFASQAALDLDGCDGLIHLWSLHAASRVEDVKRLFSAVRGPINGAMRHLLVATGLGGGFGASTDGAPADIHRGAGIAGLVKSLRREFPERNIRCVDLDLSEAADALGSHVEQELLAGDRLMETAWRGNQRWCREVVAVKAAASAGHLPLDRDSVVVITGGARGITARVAVALAQRHGCHLEIVGRSPEPVGEERAETRGITDPRQLRAALMNMMPGEKPAAIERAAKALLAERQFRETMAQIRAAGSRVGYTPLDVRDEAALSAFIESCYAKYGRIDGVIHGAGVIEDRLARDKSDESFARVFDTKVCGALTLNRTLRDDVKFVVFFSSVASVFGNKGQVDYASANDVFDKLAAVWQRRIGGQVLAVNWGPWADTGMVSEALEKEYARKGIGLIPQAEGVEALLGELAGGRQEATQVVFMCGTPESFGGVEA